jgi:hypothetical protein
MPSMTRHKATQTGLMTPSPLDRLINALLHAFAMLVSFVARRFVSRHPISAAECDGNCDPMREADFVLDQYQEATEAAASSHTRRTSASSTAHPTVHESHDGRKALMVSSERSSRPSNYEGVLTALSTSHPRACPEDLGCYSGGTLTNPHDLPTESLGTSKRPAGTIWSCGQIRAEKATAVAIAYPRMTRGWANGRTTTACAPN